MKQSTPIFKILAACVLSGVLLVLGIQIWQTASDPTAVARVYKAKTEETIAADGWVIRWEECFHTNGGTLIHQCDEGEKVGANQTLATAYSSMGALETVKEIEEKQLQLQQLEYALESYLDPDAAMKLDETITENLRTLRSELSRGDYSSAAENISELKGNILKRSHTYTTGPEIQAEISKVQKELSSLRSSLSGVTPIRASRPGTYSAVCDGYEEVLTLDFLKDLTPSKLASVSGGGQMGNVGKLIYGDTWYYAFTLSEADAQRLLDGGTPVLRFAKGLVRDVTVKIVSVSPVEDGELAIVVSCDRYLAQITQLRRQTASLLLDSYEGLRIPANALRLNEEGRSGVYCMVGMFARFKAVDVVYQGDGYTLVRAAEDATGSRILRPGDEVIISAGELYDGKVMQ